MKPTSPPTKAELISTPVVLQAMDQAWIDSDPENATNRHEEEVGYILIFLLGRSERNVLHEVDRPISTLAGLHALMV